MSATDTKSADRSSLAHLLTWLSAVFFAILFFLCSADMFFATRVHSFNLRWGQFLLLVCSLVTCSDLLFQKDRSSSLRKNFWCFLKSWGPFFLVYAIAAFFSAQAGRSFLKLGWAIFNIGGAALLFMNPRWQGALKKGFTLGIFWIALVLWAQLFLIYWFNTYGVFTPEAPRNTFLLLNSALPNWPLGYAQIAKYFESVQILRPSAFYYVPSFAACALVLATGGFIVACGQEKKRFVPIGTALVCGAVILTTSRSGLLGFFLIGCVTVVCSVFKKDAKPLIFWLKVTGWALLFIGLFCLSAEAKKYMGFYETVLRPHGIASRMGDPNQSEGGRIASISSAFGIWAEHPWLGNGVSTDPQKSPGLGQLAENTWIEVIAECGLLGMIAFLWAIGRTLFQAYRKDGDWKVKLFIFSGLIAHFVVNLSFTATYPRLDYWLLFYFCVHLLGERISANDR